MIEVRKRIMDASLFLFYEKGIKSVTIDEISKRFGGSKKTIYEHFRDKEAIVMALIERELSKHQDKFKEIRDNANNALEELVNNTFYRVNLAASLKSLSPDIFQDLLNYYPTAWKTLENFQEHFIVELTENNLKRGITEGLYRKSINVPILAKLRIRYNQWTIDQALFPADKFTIPQIHMASMTHYIYGLLTLKGHEIFNDIQGIVEKPA